MHPIDRHEAIAQGLMYYTVDKPCKRGHSAPRFVASRLCTECMGKHVTKNAAAKVQRPDIVAHALSLTLPATRDEAIAQGLEFYRSYKPCVHGHYAPRDIDNRQCLFCKYPRQYAERTSGRKEAKAKPTRNQHSRDKRKLQGGRVMAYYTGEHVLPTEFNTGYVMGDATVTTSREGQELFAKSSHATACALAPNSRSYATVGGSVAKARGDGCIAVAMAVGAKAYSQHKDTTAYATVKGALLRVYTNGTGVEDYIDDLWPRANKGLRVTI
jgi:hypothetical protein